MTGIKININDKSVNSFEMVKTIIKLIAVTKKLILSDTEVFALTYFVINGFNKVTKTDLVDNKLFKSSNAVSNLISKFRKYGIIQKTTYGESISNDYAIGGNNDRIIFQYTITNDRK